MDIISQKLLMSISKKEVIDFPYIEDVFSTYLYEGNSDNQIIVNGIDLDNNGGLVLLKDISGYSTPYLIDTERGKDSIISTAYRRLTIFNPEVITSFNNNGFALGAGLNYTEQANNLGKPYISWTFRKAPHFFDIVTYTATSGTPVPISHNLESKPGAILIKGVDEDNTWTVAIRKNDSEYIVTSLAESSTPSPLETISDFATSTTINLQSLSAYATYNTGVTYVMYLFGHSNDPNGIIKCGSYLGSGDVNGPEINLDWEPQWLLIGTGLPTNNLHVFDHIRGFTVDEHNPSIAINSVGDNSSTDKIRLTSSGFKVVGYSDIFNSNNHYGYIAIRRSPMRVPNSAAKVFKATAYNGSEPIPQYFSTGFTVDTNFYKYLNRTFSTYIWDRIRGGNQALTSASTNPTTDISTNSTATVLLKQFERNDGFSVGSGANNASGPLLNCAFARAPGFYDTVCYSGYSNAVIPHNLKVVPELWIIKGKDVTSRWFVGLTSWENYRVYLNDSSPKEYGSILGNFTAKTFTQTTSEGEVSSGLNIVYLFSSCLGVSKIGTYIGTTENIDIDCNFVSGARFVLIKRTDNAGDWYLWNHALGITGGTDPYYLLNKSEMQIDYTNYIDQKEVGFRVTSSGNSPINILDGHYMFLAIA